MKKNIIEQPKKNRKDRKQLDGNLTVGIDLGDRSSRYCILNEDGEVAQAAQGVSPVEPVPVRASPVGA